MRTPEGILLDILLRRIEVVRDLLGFYGLLLESVLGEFKLALGLKFRRNGLGRLNYSLSSSCFSSKPEATAES